MLIKHIKNGSVQTVRFLHQIQVKLSIVIVLKVFEELDTWNDSFTKDAKYSVGRRDGIDVGFDVASNTGLTVHDVDDVYVEPVDLEQNIKVVKSIVVALQMVEVSPFLLVGTRDLFVAEETINCVVGWTRKVSIHYERNK